MKLVAVGTTIVLFLGYDYRGTNSFLALERECWQKWCLFLPAAKIGGASIAAPLKNLLGKENESEREKIYLKNTSIKKGEKHDEQETMWRGSERLGCQWDAGGRHAAARGGAPVGSSAGPVVGGRPESTQAHGIGEEREEARVPVV